MRNTQPKLQKALFLDRDGVINVDHGYVHRKEDFEFMPGLFEVLRSVQAPIFVVTNQSGIGRGYYTREDFEAVTAHMKSELAKAGIEITEVFFCPHGPEEGCECRKPEAGMLLEAAKRYNIDLKNSIMVGDKPSDMQAAQKAGIGTRIIVGAKSDAANIEIETIEQLQKVLHV